MLTWNELYKPLVLCVDQDEDILDLIRMALERQGYRVLTAREVDTALAAFAVCPIDAVVLGTEMPGMSGGTIAAEMSRMKPAIPKLLLCVGDKPEGLYLLPAQVGGMMATAQQQGEPAAPALPT